MIKLRFNIWKWRMLGMLCIWLRDSGQRCYAWYGRHSPLMVLVDSSQMELAARLAERFGHNWEAYADKWDMLIPPVDPACLKPEDRIL